MKTKHTNGVDGGRAKKRKTTTTPALKDFAKKKLKVGRVVKKTNESATTSTTIRAKTLRLAKQNINDGCECDGEARTSRGTGLGEGLNQCSHYERARRRDGVRAVGEIAERAPNEVRARAGDVMEMVGMRLSDSESEVRKAARELLQRGVARALGANGFAPFAKALMLYVNAALTSVDDGVRRDAPLALDAALDVAPALMAAHGGASTLRHLGELVRRGDDGGVGAGSSVSRGVGGQKAATRLVLLKSARRFVAIVSEGIASGGEMGKVESTSGALYAERARRAPTSVLAAHYASGDAIASDGTDDGSRAAMREHAKRLVELTMSVWDDASQTLADERGVDFDRVRVMAESMTCARLALHLADSADEVEIWDIGGGATAAEVIPELSRRTLAAFPACAPSSVAEKSDVAKVREAMVMLNFETCRFLIAASSSAAYAATARQLAPSTLEALPHVLSRALRYLTMCLNGIALDGGALGSAERTQQSAYGELLALAREALALPVWCFSDSMTGSACAELVEAVTQTWTKAVIDEDTERVDACVTLLTSVLPEEAHQGYTRVPIETAASWVRHIPRVLWALKHDRPAASQKLLSLLHVVASRNPPGSPLADVLAQCETEIAVLFFIVPPPGSASSARSRPGPFARLPFACQCLAVQLIGVMPTLTAPTIRSLVKMCLDVDRVDVEISVIAVEALSANLLAAPLEVTVLLFASLLAGSPGVRFLEPSSKRNVGEAYEKAWDMFQRVASSAAGALIALGDASTPWNGVLLASAALRDIWTHRVEKGDVEGASRTAAGFALLLASAAEFASAAKFAEFDAEFVEFAAEMKEIENRDVSSMIPEILAWLVVRAEREEDVAPVKRAIAAAPWLASPIARAVLSVINTNDSAVTAKVEIGRAIKFVSVLIRSDVARESDVGATAKALQSVAAASTDVDVRKLAGGFLISISEAYGDM